MTIRNFAQEVKFEKERFQLPLIFKIGASVNAIDFFDEIDKSQHSLLVSVDATHPRDYPEQLNLGMEYQFMEFLHCEVVICLTTMFMDLHRELEFVNRLQEQILELIMPSHHLMFLIVFTDFLYNFLFSI